MDKAYGEAMKHITKTNEKFFITNELKVHRIQDKTCSALKLLMLKTE
jgi:hypothetical protein